MYSVSVDPDCNERGQTSRPVVGAEIQTSCNTEASLFGHYYLLRCVECLFNDNDVLEFPYRLRVCHDSYLTLSCNLDLLLHEDFLHAPSSSKPTARPRSATEKTNNLNIARYRKAVSTTLWLQLMLVVCYLPLLLVILVIHTESSSFASLAWSYTLTLVSLNSSLNPILYCWKMDEVRQTAKDTVRQVLGC